MSTGQDLKLCDVCFCPLCNRIQYFHTIQRLPGRHFVHQRLATNSGKPKMLLNSCVYCMCNTSCTQFYQIAIYLLSVSCSSVCQLLTSKTDGSVQATVWPLENVVHFEVTGSKCLVVGTKRLMQLQHTRVLHHNEHHGKLTTISNVITD